MKGKNAMNSFNQFPQQSFPTDVTSPVPTQVKGLAPTSNDVPESPQPNVPPQRPEPPPSNQPKPDK